MGLSSFKEKQMTSHFFENSFVKLHYYRFGNGPKVMFCFHGFGMHGRQFRLLEETLGQTYTFYGFDLFFHKKTQLADQSVEKVKEGLQKDALAQLFIDFCTNQKISKFSTLSYSMGSHFASTLVETIPERIEEVIIAAPSCFNPGQIVNFLSTNKIGNKLFERLTLSKNGMNNLISTLKRFKVIDQITKEILLKEVATYDLRFSLYASATYFRTLKIDSNRFINALNDFNIKSIFIFGDRDKNYPKKIGDPIIPKIKNAKVIVLQEDHNMINVNFSKTLVDSLNGH